MKHHLFGSTRREVPVIGQGTWYIESGDPVLTGAAMRLGFDLGIDTAELYGSREARN